METFLMWLVRICIFVWISTTAINYMTIYRRCKILEDPISYKQAIVLGIVAAIPVINVIILWASLDTMMQMFFNKEQFIKAQLPEVKATKILARKKYAEEFVETIGMTEDLDEYIASRLLMGKLTVEDKEET